MQASKINLGEHYAVTLRDGSEVALRVNEIITVRGGDGTKNYIKGHYIRIDEDGSSSVEATVEVKNVIDTVANHQRLKAEMQARADAAKALRDAVTAKRNKAIDLLAEAIGATPVHDRYAQPTNRDAFKDSLAIVVASGTSVEVNIHGLDALIAFLGNAKEYIDFLDGSTK